MSISYTIDVDKKLIKMSITGIFNFEAARQAYEKLFADPEYEPRFDTISDFSSAEQMNISFGEVMDYRALVKELDTREGMIAFVMGDNMGRYLYGKAAAIQFNIVKSNSYRAFKTRKAAMEWLNAADGTDEE